MWVAYQSMTLPLIKVKLFECSTFSVTCRPLVSDVVYEIFVNEIDLKPTVVNGPTSRILVFQTLYFLPKPIQHPRICLIP